MIIRQKERQGKEVIAYTDKELKLLDKTISLFWAITWFFSTFGVVLDIIFWFLFFETRIEDAFAKFVTLVLTCGFSCIAFKCIVMPYLTIVTRHLELGIPKLNLSRPKSKIKANIRWRICMWFYKASYFRLLTLFIILAITNALSIWYYALPFKTMPLFIAGNLLHVLSCIIWKICTIGYSQNREPLRVVPTPDKII